MNINIDINKLVKRKPLKDYIIFVLIILFGILFDQVTKIIAVKFLEPIDTLPIIKFGSTEVFNFTYVENTGAAFGMLKNAPWVFNTISVIGITVMLAYLFLGHTESMLAGISLAMVISGGIGNMIDRISLGYVVDFLHFSLINFAVFNVADSFVCVGAGMLILALILELRKEMKKEKQ